MKLIEKQTYDAERAFYGQTGVHFKDGALDGPADGESAFKECSDIVIENVFAISVTRFGTTMVSKSLIPN